MSLLLVVGLLLSARHLARGAGFGQPSCDDIVVLAEPEMNRIDVFDRRSNPPSPAHYITGEADDALRQPEAAVCRTVTDTVVVADTLNHQLREFRLDGTELGDRRILLPQGFQPSAIASARPDLIYVADGTSDRIAKVDLSLPRPPVALVNVAIEVGRIADAAVDPRTGNLYLVDEYARAVHLVEPATGKRIRTWRPHALQRPVALALVEDGSSVFVLDQVKSQVFRLDNQGEVVGAFGNHGAEDHGFFEPKDVLAVGEHLWVFDFGNRRIVATSLDGEVLYRLGEDFVRAG